MQDQLLDMLLKDDEITWKSIILDLIKSEQMNPWDIDISVLTKKYIETVKQLKEANFFISGNVLLAAALLLKIKSSRIITEDIANLDSFLFSQEEEEFDSFEEHNYINEESIPRLAIKTPQPRKKTVSVNDLIKALQNALKVSKRKEVKRELERSFRPPDIPEKKVDITALIKDIYEKIINFFKKEEQVTFSKLVMSEKREDKILTLIPLLHLDNQEKIELFQQEHFGEIEILKK